jgi:fatty-acid desaturase
MTPHTNSIHHPPPRVERFPKHRVTVSHDHDVIYGEVRWSPVKSLWFISMVLGTTIGGIATFTWSAFALFVISTLFVLLFGHSLGSHRKLIHNSFQCPRWLEYVLIYCGLQVGLAGPIGLLRQHELRDFAQRLPLCHDYLRHGSSAWRDAWWQLNCELHLANEPNIEIESRIADDAVLRMFERTWMLQHIFVAALFFMWGGWAFVFWGVCARVAAGVFGHWLVGYFAHNHGPMNYEIRGAAVQGHNIRWTSLITMGECWHNNHHAYPGSARLGLARGEWDPGWWMLRLLERVGLAWDFRLPKDLAPRPELIPLRVGAQSIAVGVYPSASIPTQQTKHESL